jgi:hypothetical protein
MKRRSFLSLSGVAAPLTSLSGAEVFPNDTPADLWWPMVNEVERFRAVSVENRLVLTVSLERPGEEEMAPIVNDGQVIGYSLRGRRLVGKFFPGISVLSAFDLVWDGRPIAIPPRFWEDLAGFRIQTLSVDLNTLVLEERAKAEAYLADLDQPRLILSADEGTALIEWDRPEKGEIKSTFRWIISRSGTVLRHRHRSAPVR